MARGVAARERHEASKVRGQQQAVGEARGQNSDRWLLGIHVHYGGGHTDSQDGEERESWAPQQAWRPHPDDVIESLLTETLRRVVKADHS